MLLPPVLPAVKFMPAGLHLRYLAGPSQSIYNLGYLEVGRHSADAFGLS